ncbi:hypothetical protein JNJ66_00595 [Candidatus Saccharibacteria bacterium]|nr:hypothetical protein [Candidatus Saccharibacteria bacterium]
MTNVQAFWAVLGGFFICLFLEQPLLWLAWVGLFIYALVRPEANGGKKAARLPVSLPVAEVTEQESAYISHLRAAIEASGDDAERQGLRRALELAEQDLQIPKEIAQADQTAAAPAVSPTILQQPVQFHRPDQTVALLYVGAFLLITAAGLFVAYGGVSGGFKFGILLAGCLLFYISGLGLLKLRSALRPAAVTFVAIGLLLLPICGVAAYSLLAIPGTLSWLLTSLLGVGLYVHATTRLRSEALGYLSILSWLSLVLSGASVLDAPLHVHVWLLILAGIGLHIFRPALRGSLAVATEPARLTGQLVVPLASLVGLLLVSETVPLWHSGVSFALAGLYYLVLARETADVQRRNATVIGAHLFLLASVLALFYDIFKDLNLLGILLALLAAGHVLWLRRMARRPLFAEAFEYDELLYYLASALALVSLVCLWGDPYLLLLGLAVSTGVHAALYRLWRSAPYAPVISVLSLAAMPIAAAYALDGLGAGRGETATAGFIIAGTVVFYARHHLAAERLTRIIGQISCLAFIAAAWIASTQCKDWWTVAGLQLVLLVSLEAVARYERWSRLTIVSPLLVFSIALAVMVGSQAQLTPGHQLLFGLLTTGVFAYVYSGITGNHLRRVAMLLWTFGLGSLAWLTATLQSGMTGYVPPLVLATFASLAMYELMRRDYLLPELRTIPAAALVIAGDQLVAAYGGIIGPGMHMLLWALYALGSAIWLEGRHRVSAKLFAAIAASLTAAAGVLTALALSDSLDAELVLRPYLTLTLMVAIGVLAFIVRHMPAMPQTINGYRAVYWAALTGIAAVALAQSSMLLAVSLLGAAAILAIWLSYQDDSPASAAAAPIFVTLATLKGLQLTQGAEQMPGDYLATVALVVGSLTGYLLVRLTRQETRRAQLVLAVSFSLVILGWLYSLWLRDNEMPLVVSPLLLGLAGGMVLMEARLLLLKPLQALVPVAMLNLALQQLVWQLMPDANWLIYTHLWALYLVYVARTMQRSGLGQLAGTVKIMALAAFSGPLILEALRDQQVYGPVLLAEHICLLVLGVVVRRAYIVYWAIIVSVIAVMYMMRSFAYFQLGLMAVTLIGFGIYRLARSERDRNK